MQNLQMQLAKEIAKECRTVEDVHNKLKDLFKDAIDNSHLFRSSRWTIDSFNKLGTKIKIYYYQHYRNLLKDLLSPQDFLPYIEIVKRLATSRSIV